MDNTPNAKSANRLGWFIFFGCVIGVLLLGLLATSITERRADKATLFL